MTDPEDDRDLSQLDGVGGKTEDKLREQSYHTILSIARADPDNLSDRTGIGSGRCEKMIDHARELVQDGDEFQTGKAVQEEQEKQKKITTGSDSLDNMLYGGVPTGYITEIYGGYGRGKTQLAHQLAVNAQLPEEEGGLEKEVVYLDTEDTFMSDRFAQMAEAQGLDPDEALENVYVAKAFDSGHQLKLGEKLHKLCRENDIGLVIVDSLTAHFRADYDGRGELAARQSALNRHMKDLRQVAGGPELAVVVTNQVLSDPGQQFGDPTKPVGGNIVAHNSTFIIYLKGQKNHYARLEDSPNLPQNEAEFEITGDGIRDV